MSLLVMQSPAPLEWMEIGEYVVTVMATIPIAVASWLYWDRRAVQRRRERGIAAIEMPERG